MDTARAYDQGILYFFGSLNRPWLDPAARALATLGTPWMLAVVVLAVACAFVRARRSRSAAVLLVVACVAAGLQLGVAMFVDRPRPDVNWRKADLPDSPGFPDGPAMRATAVYLGGALLAPRRIASRRLIDPLLIGGALVAMLVGLSRPYLGVAYPMDVLAGWVGGLACALAGFACARQTDSSGAEA